MIIDQKFSRNTNCTGRNGQSIMSGIGITSLDDYILLNPISSRNMIINCSMRIPKEDIPEFIKNLTNLS